MSHNVPPEAAPLPEETGIAYGPVIMVAVISLLIFFVGGLWSTHILRTREKAENPNGPAPIRADIDQQEKGIVDHIPFDANTWKADYDRTVQQEQHDYAWVDRKAGTIRLPIDRAMDLVVQEQKK